MAYTTVKLLALRNEMADWLSSNYQFHYFVTLAPNKGVLSTERMRRLFLLWDAQVNRKLYGPKWQKLYAERLFIFAALEKPHTNSHWHLLVRLMDYQFEGEAAFESRGRLLQEVAEPCWQRVVKSGSLTIEPIWDLRGAVEYSVKELCNPIQYESWIVPDECFRR